MRTKRRNLYYVAIASVVAFTFGLYFYTFHGRISDDSSVWSNFGNYINGLLTPLLTIINIAVFIELTIAIYQLEEQRSEKALENEREVLLMQLRKQEIDTFIQQMNRLNNYSSREEHIESVQQIWYYLQDFEKTGSGPRMHCLQKLVFLTKTSARAYASPKQKGEAKHAKKLKKKGTR